MAGTSKPPQKFTDDEETILINMVKAMMLHRLNDEDGTENEGHEVEKLLSFDEERIDGIYDFDQDSGYFHFDFAQFETAVRCEEKVERGSTNFKAKWIGKPFVELGINYAGVIKIKHEDSPRSLKIKVVGVRSYDPAGNSEVARKGEIRIGENYWSMMIAVAVAEIMAAMYGASEQFIEVIQDLTRNIIKSYHGGFMMHEWMGHQVIEACFNRKKPLVYHDFMHQQITMITFGDKGHGHTKDYLEKVARYNAGQCSDSLCKPHQVYFQAIVNAEDAKTLQETHSSEEYAALLEHASLMKVMSNITLKYLPSTISELQIKNHGGDDMSEIRRQIDKLQNDFHESCNGASSRYAKNGP